ncbi:MAG: hypothetical protein K9L68_08565 [Spirochaetales bacterium]|nr:hypothetical protein [Spirochaetales bacterium]MCF7938637.1 hypothetical protein [Spirochaetales bacterium]
MKKRSFLIILVFVLIFMVCGGLYGDSPVINDKNNDGDPDQWIEYKNDYPSSIKSDRNFDGKVDYYVELTKEGNKTYEEMDYNHDGQMDDFSFFEEGVIVRRKIDSNHDDQVDVWIFIHEGIYIKRYELDTDFDGTVDKVKDYDE